MADMTTDQASGGRAPRAEMTTDQFIGERVHQVMWRLKLKQTRVAPQMGITQTALSRKIHGERSWSLDELALISTILGVPVANLVPPQIAAILTGAADGDTGTYTPRFLQASSRSRGPLSLVPALGDSADEHAARNASVPTAPAYNWAPVVAPSAGMVNCAHSA